MRESRISKDGIKEVVPKKYHNYAGIGPYYLPFFGKMYWNRLKKAMLLMPYGNAEGPALIIGDMGSGFGIFATLLGNSFPKSKIIGLDVYPIDALIISRAISNRHNVQNTIFVRGDICALPFSDNKFDILFALDVLEHVPDPLSALYELKRVLKEDGILIISVPVESKILGFVRRLVAIVKPIETHPHWRAMKSFETFDEHLSSVFKIERRFWYPYNVFGRHLNYGCLYACSNH